MQKVVYDYSKLKGRAREKQITQKELARMAGMSESTFSLIVNNKAEFSQQEINAIARLLEIKPGELGVYFFSEHSLEKINKATTSANY